MARLPPLFYPSSLEFFPSSPNLSSGLSSNHFLFLFSFSPLFSFLLPYFRSRHGVFFEATGSLLSLLRSGARDAYRQFFVDSMSLIQGTLKISIMHSMSLFQYFKLNYCYFLLYDTWVDVDMFCFRIRRYSIRGFTQC